MQSYLLFLMALLSTILSFFGCKPKFRTEVHDTPYGPFTIRMTTRHSRQLNMNYGFVNDVRTDYAVLYRGAPVRFPGALEVNTGLPGLWKVYQLEGAPVPTLLAGSQSLYLIREQAGEVAVTALDVQSSDFASWQWLDSENGQPGPREEVFSSNDSNVVQTLTGGTYLLLSDHTVLHVPTLQTWVFNKENHVIDEYFAGDRHGARLFSPDKKQLAYLGNKNDPADYMRFLNAMVVFDYAANRGHAVPFDQTATRLQGIEYIDRAWLETWFEWKKQPDGAYALALRAYERPPYWTGYYSKYDDEVQSYNLRPVNGDALFAMLDFICQELGVDRAAVEKDTATYKHEWHIPHGDLLLDVSYEPDEQRVMVSPYLYAENKTGYQPVIRRLGEAFDARLRKGEFQDMFTSF